MTYPSTVTIWPETRRSAVRVLSDLSPRGSSLAVASRMSPGHTTRNSSQFSARSANRTRSPCSPSACGDVTVPAVKMIRPGLTRSTPVTPSIANRSGPLVSPGPSDCSPEGTRRTVRSRASARQLTTISRWSGASPAAAPITATTVSRSRPPSCASETMLVTRAARTTVCPSSSALAATARLGERLDSTGSRRACRCSISRGQLANPCSRATTSCAADKPTVAGSASTWFRSRWTAPGSPARAAARSSFAIRRSWPASGRSGRACSDMSSSLLALPARTWRHAEDDMAIENREADSVLPAGPGAASPAQP